MGQAFDRDGKMLGEAFGETKREVFDKLISEFKDAHEIRIRTVEERAGREQVIAEVSARERFEREHGSTSVEMPRYECHKRVHALKIADVIDPTEPGNETDGSRIIVPADKGFAPFRVKHDYVRKHDPKPGGYYVVYEDGYASFSPAGPFESGYARI